jgi:lipoprotein-releasing system ATP-binding protein
MRTGDKTGRGAGVAAGAGTGVRAGAGAAKAVGGEMIAIKNLRKSFGKLTVLKGITLSVGRGEIVSVVGPSGAGKTTLLQIAGTLSRPDSGSVVIDGVDVGSLKDNELSAFRNSRVGFVFQFHNLLPEFTAFENVCIPGYIGGRDRREVEAHAAELIDLLGLGPRRDHKPAELSGGEAQRVAIARALVNSPSVILADEPSGNLDSRNRDEIHRLFFSLRERFGPTIIIVTHDENLASMADRRVTMRDGIII